MIYRREPITGIIYTKEAAIQRYIKELPEAGAIEHVWEGWEKVEVYYDSKADTMLHIKRVQELLSLAARELLKRGEYHDQSKLEMMEKELFDAFTPKLAGCTYGSEEYKAFLIELKPALDHHYQHNSHHPEHYPFGINGMDLFDLMEMFFDWKAAGERHNNGNIFNSLRINKQRFNISDQVYSILVNTADRLGYRRPGDMTKAQELVHNMMKDADNSREMYEKEHPDENT